MKQGRKKEKKRKKIGGNDKENNSCCMQCACRQMLDALGKMLQEMTNCPIKRNLAMTVAGLQGRGQFMTIMTSFRYPNGFVKYTCNHVFNQRKVILGKQRT